MKQELKSEISKEVILNKAFQLFYENGFKATSIEKIMNATTFSKGAFYYHYKNKKELGLDVISLKLQKRVIENMILPLSEPGDALKILNTVFIDTLKSFSFYHKKHGCPTNNFINEIGDFEDAYQAALKNIIEKWKSVLITLIERGKAEKSIHIDIPSNGVAIYLISAFEGIRGIRKLYNDDKILDEYIAGLALYLKQLEA